MIQVTVLLYLNLNTDVCTFATSDSVPYNLAGAGVLVCIRWSSYVVPHLARSHDQNKALKQRGGDIQHLYTTAKGQQITFIYSCTRTQQFDIHYLYHYKVQGCMKTVKLWLAGCQTATK